MEAIGDLGPGGLMASVLGRTVPSGSANHCKVHKLGFVFRERRDCEGLPNWTCTREMQRARFVFEECGPPRGPSKLDFAMTEVHTCRTVLFLQSTQSQYRWAIGSQKHIFAITHSNGLLQSPQLHTLMGSCKAHLVPGHLKSSKVACSPLSSPPLGTLLSCPPAILAGTSLPATILAASSASRCCFSCHLITPSPCPAQFQPHCRLHMGLLFGPLQLSCEA